MKTDNRLLPEGYAERIQGLLGEEEAEAYFRSLDMPRTYGLRPNTAKFTPEDF